MLTIQLSCWPLLPLLALSSLSVEDRTIVLLLLRAEPSFKHVTIVKRFPASDQLNLVLAIAEPRASIEFASDTFAWTNDRRRPFSEAISLAPD